MKMKSNFFKVIGRWEDSDDEEGYGPMFVPVHYFRNNRSYLEWLHGFNPDIEAHWPDYQPAEAH